jgi:hypothetical protein
MRRFTLRLIVAFLAFIIGLTAAIVIGKVNPFHRSHSRCVERNWSPPPPPAPPVEPVAPAAPEQPASPTIDEADEDAD